MSNPQLKVNSHSNNASKNIGAINTGLPQRIISPHNLQMGEMSRFLPNSPVNIINGARQDVELMSKSNSSSASKKSMILKNFGVPLEPIKQFSTVQQREFKRQIPQRAQSAALSSGGRQKIIENDDELFCESTTVEFVDRNQNAAHNPNQNLDLQKEIFLKKEPNSAKDQNFIIRKKSAETDSQTRVSPSLNNNQSDQLDYMNRISSHNSQTQLIYQTELFSKNQNKIDPHNQLQIEEGNQNLPISGNRNGGEPYFNQKPQKKQNSNFMVSRPQTVTTCSSISRSKENENLYQEMKTNMQNITKIMPSDEKPAQKLQDLQMRIKLQPNKLENNIVIVNQAAYNFPPTSSNNVPFQFSNGTSKITTFLMENTQKINSMQSQSISKEMLQNIPKFQIMDLSTPTVKQFQSSAQNSNHHQNSLGSNNNGRQQQTSTAKYFLPQNKLKKSDSIGSGSNHSKETLVESKGDDLNFYTPSTTPPTQKNQSDRDSISTNPKQFSPEEPIDIQSDSIKQYDQEMKQPSEIFGFNLKIQQKQLQQDQELSAGGERVQEGQEFGLSKPQINSDLQDVGDDEAGGLENDLSSLGDSEDNGLKDNIINRDLQFNDINNQFEVHPQNQEKAEDQGKSFLRKFKKQSQKEKQFQEKQEKDMTVVNQQSVERQEEEQKEKTSTQEQEQMESDGIKKNENDLETKVNAVLVLSEKDLNNVMLGEQLGEGAYGQVFKALLTSNGQFLAVKQIKFSQNDQRSKVDFIHQISQEIDILQNYTHQNIVHYYGCKEEQESQMILIYMEYMPGGSIASMLNHFGPFNEKVIQQFVYQLLLGLNYLHSQRIVHRDLKGANILSDGSGNVQLADFGAARHIENIPGMSASNSQICKSVKGSLYWMAPQLLNQENHGTQIDIWSLGCTIIEMATASHPWQQAKSFTELVFQIMDQKCPDIPDHLSSKCKDFIKICFTFDKKQRPKAAELLRHQFLRTDSK